MISSQPIIYVPKQFTEFVAEFIEFAAELSEFPLPKHSRHSIPGKKQAFTANTEESLWKTLLGLRELSKPVVVTKKPIKTRETMSGRLHARTFPFIMGPGGFIARKKPFKLNIESPFDAGARKASPTQWGALESIFGHEELAKRSLGLPPSHPLGFSKDKAPRVSLGLSITTQAKKSPKGILGRCTQFWAEKTSQTKFGFVNPSVAERTS